MRSLSHANARDEIIERISRLTPENQRRWGQMEVSRVPCHLADQLRMALADIPTGTPRGPARYAPLRFLLLHVLPWPKGKVQAPAEAFTTPPTSWDADRAALLDLIARFAHTPPDELASTHPVFGPMTSRDWAVLSYRHLDHHLRQFSA